MADKEKRPIPVMELKGVTKEYCLRESMFSIIMVNVGIIKCVY